MSTLHPGTPVADAAALVTGGNRGFGLALVNELLHRGATRVYAAARTPHSHPDPRVIPLVLDVTDDASVHAAAQTATDISILINNAGVLLRSSAINGSLDDIRAELETNLFGTLRVTRACAPVLAQHPSSAVLNVLSALSWLSLGGGYEISKAAAWSATNALRLQLAAQGTLVTALHVAYMDTDMTAALDVPKLDPREVARQCVDGIVAGALEVLADETTRHIKSSLSADIATQYPKLAALAHAY